MAYRTRAALAALGVAVLAACSKTESAAPPPFAVASGSGAVGYVRMTDLVKHHPLYAVLTGYDESIEALNLRPVVPDVVKPDASIARAEAALQQELAAAANRTRKLLAEKSAAYSAREAQAITLALHAPPGTAPSAAQIAQEINANAHVQTAGVAAQANHDFDAYRKTLVDQDNDELRAAQRALAARAERQYRAKQEELSAKESALSLAQASRDAATRLSLRTRLSSLALDDAQRDDVRNQLAALDRSESDVLAALKNRDAQTLAALGAQLRAGVQRDMQAKAREIHARSIAKLGAREADLRREFGGGSPAVLAAGVAVAGTNGKLAPQLRSTLEALHANYQRQFNSDAKSTIDDFNRTREELQRRYEQLRAVDASAQSGASAQIATLSKKRDDLYGQMVAQIGREVRLIAQARGISVVVTDPVANAGGVDLTADALKNIESLHE